MSHYWILLSLSCFGLQFINAEPLPQTMDMALTDTDSYPIPYLNYLIQPPLRNEVESADNAVNIDSVNKMYQQEDELLRKRRLIDDQDVANSQWLTGLEDVFISEDDKEKPQIIQGFIAEENSTDKIKDKKSFSPWGGKRAQPNLENNMWTWKREANIKEPTMPKRVRFSPWGGKRNGQMIFKPGSKASKLLANYSPLSIRWKLGGLQIIPDLDKHHFQILSLSTKMDDKSLRDELPFKTYIQSLPRLFKPGHTYSDVNFKKEGKRKVKFSTWGGKRSPPIIGPIWSKTREDLKQSVLDALLLITNGGASEAPKV